MKNFLIVAIILIMTSFGLNAQKQYQADTDASSIKWTGKKVTGEHWGYVPIENGYIIVNEGRIVSGEITANMNLLNVQDLEDEESNQKLTGHLKSPDFFSVAQYPQAYFRINKALVNAFASDGEPNYTFSGELTIKGITHPITFPAIVKVGDNKLTAKANFVFNRAKYEVKFGSGSFFDGLGDNLIYDEVPLNINLVAEVAEEDEDEDEDEIKN